MAEERSIGLNCVEKEVSREGEKEKKREKAKGRQGRGRNEGGQEENKRKSAVCRRGSKQ